MASESECDVSNPTTSQQSTAAYPHGWQSMVHAPGCTKPDVFMVLGCTCGANVSCRTCGWGRGAMPCKCKRRSASMRSRDAAWVHSCAACGYVYESQPLAVERCPKCGSSARNATPAGTPAAHRQEYRTIVADPPWHYPSFKGRPMPYSTMTTDEIAALSVCDLAAPDCRLFLWTTNRHLHEAFHVLAEWKFGYSQTLVWHKTGDPIQFAGGIAPVHAEFVLVGRRGKPAKCGTLPSSVLSLPTNNHNPHSKKPEAFLDLVEQISPGPYLELFSRRARLGWDTWGDEALQHVELSA